MEKKIAVQKLMDLLREEKPISLYPNDVLFMEGGRYYRMSPNGQKIEIQREEVIAELRAFIERARRK